MMIPYVHELTLVGVSDPAVPNQERLLLRPTEMVNLGQFGVLLGRRQPDGSAIPLLDHFLWFGDVVVTPPCWVVVYTGPGQFQQTRLPNGEAAFVYHWGKTHTLFHVQGIVPVVFRMGGILVGQLPIPEQTIPALSKGHP